MEPEEDSPGGCTSLLLGHFWALADEYLADGLLGACSDWTLLPPLPRYPVQKEFRGLCFQPSREQRGHINILQAIPLSSCPQLWLWVIHTHQSSIYELDLVSCLLWLYSVILQFSKTQLNFSVCSSKKHLYISRSSSLKTWNFINCLNSTEKKLINVSIKIITHKLWLTERIWVLIVPGSFVDGTYYIRDNWSCVHLATWTVFHGCLKFSISISSFPRWASETVLVLALKWQNGNSELIALFCLESDSPLPRSSLSFNTMFSQHLNTALAFFSLWFKWIVKFLGRKMDTCAEDSLDSRQCHYFLGFLLLPGEYCVLLSEPSPYPLPDLSADKLASPLSFI